MPSDTQDSGEATRRAIFAVLVEAQDKGVSPAASRLKVVVAFGVHVELVQKIEREGLEKEWPPL
jgi:hypothetical protein